VQSHPALARRPIYLDYNATTPVDPRVAAAMRSALTEDFGNPSSQHAFGEGPRRSLSQARAQVAALIGAAEHEVVFVGSGSEADALAVRGVALARAGAVRGRAHVVTQVTEHPAVLAACRRLHEHHSVDVTHLPVDRDGRVSATAVADAITPSTVLVTVMHANNETGVVQPIAEIAEVCRDRGVPLHTDAAQSAGKVDLDVDRLGVDLLTMVGHKMYAPKGIAALYVRDGVALEPLVGGGGQEGGRRAGTENVALAAALGAAARLAGDALAAGETERLAGLRDTLAESLQLRLPGLVTVNGHPTHRLPTTLNLCFEGVRAQDLLGSCREVAASAGSACHAGHDDPSPVLLAMGRSPQQAMSAVRLSAGRWTTHEEVTTAAAALSQAADRLRAASS
jgi:cysteine desulfurase